MRFAFADPPYPGQAKRHYEGHPDYAGEVDYLELLRHLELEYPDGWALCLGSVDVQDVSALCAAVGLNQKRGDYRIGAWVKPFASFKPGVNPAYTWEPVVFRGGRRLSRDVPTVKDHVAASITLRRGCAGAKPDAFSVWVFQMLGLELEDELHDLFPGSGAVSDAWRRYRDGLRMARGEAMVLGGVFG